MSTASHRGAADRVSARPAAEPAAASLEVRALSFGHARALFDRLSFTVAPGQVLVVLGPNGVGKTTLFRTLLGAIPALGGQVRWSGRELGAYALRELSAEVAYVPQQPSAAFDLTVAEYAMLGRMGRLGLMQSPGPRDREAVDRALQRLGVSGLASRALSRLSGGERQLAAIARAFAQGSKAVVLDEPIASLDAANQVRVLDALGALSESGHSVVYSTHDPNHALRLASQVLLMMPDGRSEIGSVGEVVCLRSLTEAYAVRIDDAFTPDGRRVISWTAADRQPVEGPAFPPDR